ncbi:oocyte zinc finger protein XlCOF8.4-like isoform X2 [Pseudophryne corroboree]
MPKCIIDYCRNYAGMRRNIAKVSLHVFPTTVDRIKSWLRSIKQSGQVFKNLNAMALKIHKGKKDDSYRVCSEHFSKYSYMFCGGKKVLKKDAVPTVFTQQGDAVACVSGLRSKKRRGWLLRQQANKPLKKRSNGLLQHRSQSTETKRAYKTKSSTVNDRKELTRRILNLTLDIIYLLTGEDYIVVNKSAECITPEVSGGLNRTQSPMTVPSPHSLTHDRDNEQKILELTNKIIQLLTGEEGEYKGHKDMMMENQQPLMSPDCFHKKDTPHTEICSLDSIDMDTSVISDCKPSNCFQILKSTDNMEKSEKNASVLCEEKNVTDPDIYEPKYQKQSTSTHIKEELTSCDGGDLTDTDMYTPTGHIQYTATHIKEEPVSCDGGDLTDTDMYTPTGHIQYTATHIKEEPVSCDEGDLKDTDMYTPTDHIQSISTHIKEELVLCDGGDLKDTDMCTPTDHIQSTSTHIKEELVSCDGGDLKDTDMCTSTGHTQYTATHIKEEPVSCDGGDLKDTGMYTPTGHTQYTATHIKEEPVSCDGGELTDTDMYTPTGHTQSTFTHIKEKLVSYDAEDLTDSDMYRSTGHTQYTFNYIKEEPMSCDGGNLTHTGMYIPTDHTQSTSTHIKEELVSCDGEDTDTDMITPIGHTQSTFTPVKEESVSCDSGNLTDTDMYTPTDHTQSTATHIKEESVSCDGEDTDMCTPTGHTQSTSTHTTEEPVSGDGGDLTHTDMYTPTYNTQYTSHIKEEPMSCDGGNLTHTDMYTPTYHTQYTSIRSKEEPISCHGGNLTHTYMYTPTHHTQYTSTHIKAEPMSGDGGNLTHTYMYTPTYTQYASHIMKDLVSYHKDNVTNIDTYTPTYYTPYLSTHTEYTPPRYQNNHMRKDFLGFGEGSSRDVCALRKHEHTKYTFAPMKEGSASEEDKIDVDTQTYASKDHKKHESIPVLDESVSGEEDCTMSAKKYNDIYTPTNHMQYIYKPFKFALDHAEMQRISGNDLSDLLPCPDCRMCFISAYDLSVHLGVHAAEKQIATGKRGRGKRVFAISTFFPPFVEQL